MYNIACKKNILTIQKLTLSSWPWPAVAVCSWPTSVARTEIHQRVCLRVPASICLCLPVSLTNALCLYQRYQLWTKNIRCCCVTEKVKVSSEASCNLRSKACCAVWSVHKQATVNRTWWGIWHVFDTTIHRPRKHLQYSWSTNSTTTLDMCWQFVILNGLHRLVLRKREESLFNYLSIYLFRSYIHNLQYEAVFLLSYSVNRYHSRFPQGRFINSLKKLWVMHTIDLYGCPCYSPCVTEYKMNKSNK